MVDMQTQTKGERIAYWDNVKGILIFLVVLGHFLWHYLGMGTAGYIVGFIYIFHMPAFIFVSGFFSRSEHSRSKESLFRLAVIYIVFNTAMMIVSFFVFKSSFQMLTPAFSYWFLLSLILWRIVVKAVPRSKPFILLLVAASVLVGLWKDVTNVLAMTRTIVFFPFFYLGYRLPVDKFNDFIHHRKRLDYLKGLLVFTYAIALSLLFLNRYPYLKQADFLMDNYSSSSDMVVRVIMLCLAGLMTGGILMLTPVKPIPLINQWGRNSISIYILHRFITFIFVKAFPAATYSDLYILFALGASVLTTLALGSQPVTNAFNRLISKLAERLASLGRERENTGKPFKTAALYVLAILCLMLPLSPTIRFTQQAEVDMPVSVQEDIIHPVMTPEQENALNNTLKIAFVGDLILLQDQVRDAYNTATGEYDFSPMFEYAKKYLTAADFAIGIFEGPTAGEEAGYSTSNFDDGIPLYLNYPDSFAEAVKQSGIDLVSTANNHLLDKGVEGALRTLDVLDSVGLLHVGSWRNPAEKASIPVVDVQGIRIAFLAYTYGSNYYQQAYFLRNNPSITSILTDPVSPYFEEVKEAVLADFQRIKALDNPPDLIAVIPHMGTQFSHETDEYQDTWNDIFVEAGADIILGDHAHAVQPVEFRQKADGSGESYAVIVNCPGNFANSYVEHNGDATAIVEIYLDKKEKRVTCAAVIPMYTQAPSGGSYRALPVYDILTDPVLHKEISRSELQRVDEVNRIITKVMLGVPLTLDQARERHYLFPQGYFRQAVSPLELTPEMKNTAFYRMLSEAKSVCFVGDSITAGSKNGGFGWYEPLMAAFPEHTVYKQAWGSATTKTLLERLEGITGCDAELFVIAIGTNDVRYRDENLCAMDTQAYIHNISTLTDKIREKNPDAQFVFVSPWLARDNDPYTKVSNSERDRLLDEYGGALEGYCREKGFLYINPNPTLRDYLTRYAPSDFLLDHIHPNAGKGIILYSEKTLEAAVPG